MRMKHRDWNVANTEGRQERQSSELLHAHPGVPTVMGSQEEREDGTGNYLKR